MAFEFDVIHTLEARSRPHLEIWRSEFGLDDAQMHREILLCYAQLRAQLQSVNIDYMALKGALVPATKKFETAFFFDWTRFSTNFYGQEVMDILLPNLDRGGSRSVLYGDWLDEAGSFAQAFEQSCGPTDLGARFPNAWGANTVACYYINNLTKTGQKHLDEAFSKHPAYIAAVDLEYTSWLKALLSTMLIRAFIQHKNFVISGHEDGSDPRRAESYLLWNFKGAGLTERTVDTSLYELFLSYKIECPVLEYERDVQMSLNALTSMPVHINDCAVEVDEPRLGYLREWHGPALTYAGLAELTAPELAERIREKMRRGYIYSMSRSREDDTLKFNVILETTGQSRIQCALKYMPSQSRLSVVTML